MATASSHGSEFRRDISKLRLPEDLATFLSLPLPISTLESASVVRLFRTARRCVELWLAIASGTVSIPTEKVPAKSPYTGEAITIEGAEVVARLLFSLGTHYDFAARALAESKLPKGEVLIPGLHLAPVKDLIRDWRREDLEPRWFALRLLTVNYFTCWQASYFCRSFGASPVSDSLILPFEKIAHDSLLGLNEDRMGLSGYARGLAEYLLQSSVRFLASIYNQKAIEGQDHRAGLFSALKINELPLLARREPTVIRKYGLKQIERLFEYQLSLLMQSLGFFVAQTRIGLRTVDMVCISGVARSQYSFLLEAKTTAASYSLPTKDRRALAEYVKEVQKNLVTISPLRFVLIVGPAGCGTLDGRLREVEAQAGIPVRFCTASQLADLREHVPGPIFLDHFQDAILNSPHVLPVEFPGSVVAAYEALQRNTAEYVRSMLLSAPSRHSVPADVPRERS